MKGHPPDPGMGIIVQTVARWLKGFLLLYGIYVVLHGHISPGGGFEGGVVVACSFILLTLAGGAHRGLSFFSYRAASMLASFGVLLFLALAWAGTWWADGAFFRNFITTSEGARFTLFSGGIIPVANIGLGLVVASSLFMVFIVLAAFRALTRNESREEDDT